MTTDTLAMGILLDGPVMRRWAVEAVERAIDRANVSVEQVILAADEEPDSTGLVRRYASSGFDTDAWASVLGMHQVCGQLISRRLDSLWRVTSPEPYFSRYLRH